MAKVGVALLIVAVVFGCNQDRPSKKPNVLLICIDDLRPELRSFGAGYIHSPHIDQLAAKGRAFHSHYVNAPSCGPSRYSLLTGLYGPADNYALFKRAEKIQDNIQAVPPSMPEWFRDHEYTTVSVGKVSHHPGGRGGIHWDDSTKLEMPNAWDRSVLPVGAWLTPKGVMHGLAHGEVRTTAEDMDVFQSVEGEDTIYPDGLIVQKGIEQLKELASSDKPFFLAIGLIKPHLPFGAPKRYRELYEETKLPAIPHSEKPTGQTTWHDSGEFMKYHRWDKDPRQDPEFADAVRKHYAACVSYADHHVGQIMAALKRSGADRNTIVVLWGDHGWHLGEHAIWGKHSLFEESLRSPLIIYYPDIAYQGIKTDAIVESLDIFPTLCELAGIDIPEFVKGVSLLDILENPAVEGHTAVAYREQEATIRTATHRLVIHQNDFVELYDHTSNHTEEKNIADQNPQLVMELRWQLSEKVHQ